MTTFNDILSSTGVDPAQVKILRHGQLNWTKPYQAWHTNRPAFLGYQSRQGSRGVIPDRGYVAAFAIDAAGRTVFVGLFEIRGWKPCPLGSADPITGELYTDPAAGGRVYDLEHDDRLTGYEDRLVIDWPRGSAGRRWDRWATSRDWQALEGAETDVNVDQAFVTPGAKARIRAEVDTLEVEALGLALVEKHLKALGWTDFSDVREDRDSNGKKLGYDLLAKRSGQELHIELKATGGLYQSEVTLTANEKDVAERDPLWVLALATDVRRDSAMVEWMSRHDARVQLSPTVFRADLTQGRRHATPGKALD